MSSENMNPTQSSLYGMQHAALKSYTINQLERLNFQPSFTPRNGILNKQQQYQQPPRQFPQPEHYVQQQQAQLKLQNQQPLNLVNNDGFGQLHISGMQTQFGQRTSEYFTKDDPFLSFQPVHNAQTSHQMLHPHHLTSQPENNFLWPSVGTQSNSAHESQWSSQSQDINHIAGNTSKEQLVQSNFHQQILSKDKAQFNNLSSYPSIVAQSVEPQESANTTNNIHLNQQRWLLLMFHARRCVAPEGQCPEKKCASAQKLCKHIDNCNLTPHYCSYPCCYVTKRLLYHFTNCKDPCCPVCVAVRNFPRRYLKRESQIQPINISGMPIAANESYKSYDSEFQSHSLIRKRAPAIENSEDHEPSRKRLKFEHSNSGVSSGDTSMVIESEPIEVKEVIVQMENENLSDVNKSDTEDVGTTCEPVAYNDPEPENAKTENETAKDKSASMTQKFENALGTKSGKPKIKVVSMIEQFPPELVRQHITSLKQWTSQNKARAKKHQAKKQSMSQNLCQLCDLGKLDFNIPPIDCSICSFQLKRNVMYYYTCISHKHHYVCTQCYKKADGDIIVVDGTRILKGSLEKWKNDEEVEEGWVQCDECQAWQHQICALFNGKINVGGEAEYICPYCYIEEVERGEHIPLHENAILRAKDLPRTILSDHLEERLFTKLKHERQERARVQGKSYDEVPGAEQLVIRVVSSVDKKLEVKQRFLKIFQEENYPTEFPYKSKVVLLFQMIEGVEVLLFGMYVQEYGTECQFPNQRRVYLSYLDSVKYFQPEIKTTTGEALRTFVYHEIIIGYLEYCKKRGFTSCYIWVCPPFKGDDYILYCHPEIQKTPKLDKLREWYLSMLRKAAEDDIVVDLTNLYDHFFVSTGECRAKVTAARLPYFDGDYWPGAAEDLIHLLSQEEDGRKQNKKGTIKTTITKRALKASGQTDLSGNASKDLRLMNKLGKAIEPMKKDFIMVHLQHACNHCCLSMVSGNRWVCNQCKNFQICDKCYEAEQSCEDRERHPINQQEKHFFNRIEISGVPSDTKDKDGILESEFLDTRQAFLSHCQENHYQFDTLRRAKHSSMMLIDLLHNPTASAFMQYSQRNWSSSTCNLCSIHIDTIQGWRCETCPDFDVCNTCYQKGVVDHQHKLTKYPSLGGDSQSKEARQQQVLQIREILVLLLHASQCRTQCLYPSCRKMKVLFRHVTKCEIHASGGCSTCKMVWKMLHLHARTCKESQCHVPRCRVIREHLGKLQQQSESQQRKTVNEVIRERAAEAAKNAQ